MEDVRSDRVCVRAISQLTPAMLERQMSATPAEVEINFAIYSARQNKGPSVRAKIITICVQRGKHRSIFQQPGYDIWAAIRIHLGTFEGLHLLSLNLYELTWLLSRSSLIDYQAGQSNDTVPTSS